MDLSDCIASEVAHLYLTRGLTRVAADPSGDEELVVRTVPLGDALAEVDEGSITDAMSVIGLLRIARTRSTSTTADGSAGRLPR